MIECTQIAYIRKKSKMATASNNFQYHVRAHNEAFVYLPNYLTASFHRKVRLMNGENLSNCNIFKILALGTFRVFIILKWS